MPVHEIANDLFLADLDQDRVGFRQFISCWVIRDRDSAVVIDPGPSNTVPNLARQLGEIGVRSLRYILLTHIHIDHGGGAGSLHSLFPEAKVLCHPEGMFHLAQPEKLWKSTSRTLGEVAALYGPFEPIPEGSLIFEDRIETGPYRIETLKTPGHAPHHLAFRMNGTVFCGDAVGETIFCGDAIGVVYPVEGNEVGQREPYLRLAAGPGFSIEDYIRSLELISSLHPSRLCFAHYGCTLKAQRFFGLSSAQVRIWSRLAGEADATVDRFEETVFAKVLEEDRAMKNFRLLPADIQARERYFSLNTIRGLKNCLPPK